MTILTFENGKSLHTRIFERRDGERATAATRVTTMVRDGGLPHAEEDILATDLDESVLSIAVAPLFGTKYLEKAHAEGKPAGKVSAIMYGSKIRPMANLTVSRQGGPVVWAPFLLDTGSAATVLNEGTLAAIGVKDVIPESVN
ncbi:uncharacterized protein HaLaN_33001, partial [Haematococcus lacustris]